MNNFTTRAITGAFFVLVMIGGILWNIWSFIALFSLIAILGLWEFYSLIEQREKSTQKIPGLLLGVLLIATSCGKYFLNVNNILHLPGIHFIILLFPLFLILKLFSKGSPFAIFSPTLFGILYSVLPFCYLLMDYSSVSYYNSENNAHIILGFFILIWSNDTFAYLVGMSIGKTKLFERISPKKTWEGTIGGVLCTQGIAFLLSIYITELTPIHWFAVALIVSVFGTLGDLVESMFKRSLGVKDSGIILPGHGGILDRFDGVLLSAPFVISYLTWVQ
jgi:phosphatidate cytidylyltransferase